MADYFTNFSVVLPLNKEQQEHALNLVKLIEGHRFDDHPLPADLVENTLCTK